MAKVARNIVVDVESDGQCPGKFSMVSFGAVVLEDFTQTFYGQMRPISHEWQPDALAVSGHSREQIETFDDPAQIMLEFDNWLKGLGADSIYFWSDNNGFDWQFINYYFWVYRGYNPFGWSSRNINDLYKGLNGDMYASFKHLRKTKHTHNPLDDAMGNAEALREIQQRYDIRISRSEDWKG